MNGTAMASERNGELPSGKRGSNISHKIINLSTHLPVIYHGKVWLF